jgi:hypothetical protein
VVVAFMVVQIVLEKMENLVVQVVELADQETVLVRLVMDIIQQHRLQLYQTFHHHIPMV